MTKLMKSQKKKYGPKTFKRGGKTYSITAVVRHDDECGNGNNSFSITGTIIGQGGHYEGGCIHEEISKHFPELAPFIMWHLCSTDGPMHYVANTVYHVEQGKLNYARSSAIWPEATDEELTSPDLAERLKARLPELMVRFQKAVESLGLEY